MKKGIFIALMTPLMVNAQTVEKAPDGANLIWFLAVLILLILVIIANMIFRNRIPKKAKAKDIAFRLETDRKFKPTVVTLAIENNSNLAVDIDAPILTFHNIFGRKKMRITSANGRKVYPLFLDPNGVHRMAIPTETFFKKSKALKYKGFLKVKIKDVDGRVLGVKQIRLNKYLFF